mgnify:FL=1
MNEIINVPEENKDQRIDLFLVDKLIDTSRANIQKNITEGCILVNGKTVKSNYKLRLGDVIEIIQQEVKETKIEAEKIFLDVLYEDSDIIVINKARGMVVHPAVGNYSGTLVNALLAHCKDLSGINGEIRPGIVHRLDKETTGVMVAAKNDKAHLSLAKQIKDKTAHRKYLAIVHGNIKEDYGVINGAIGRHKTDRKKMAVVTENGKEATTNFKVLERFGEYTLVECKLLTGRTHQIRVHMTYIGHPIVGDNKYGVRKSPFKIDGQALHSESLELVHPILGTNMSFTAPLPNDMVKILERLKSTTKR